VSDCSVRRSSWSHRQLGWKSAFGLAAYGRTVSSDWSVPLSVREVIVPALSQMLTHVDGKLSRMSDGLWPRIAIGAANLLARSVVSVRVHSKPATWLILPVVICLSQRLSHACLSTSLSKVKPRMAH
jgi:hypothetical protein